MRKDRRARPGPLQALAGKLQISKRLTPKERQALGLVVGLFLLGMAVRWYRLAHLP